MSVLYWIIILSNISAFLEVLATVGLIMCSLAFISDHYAESDDIEKTKSRRLRIIAACLIVLFLDCFIPTKRDMYVIYGVGSTIDYIKSNDTARQLPDKAIVALDKWLDSVQEKPEK